MTETTSTRDEAVALRRAIRGLVRRFSLSEKVEVSCCGMTVPQAGALETLRMEGPMRPGMLGRKLGIQPSTATRNLARMEERGLIARGADPEDARATTVGLTEAGHRAAEEYERRADEFFESILERIPADRRARALQGLKDLLEAVCQATEGCCTGAFEHLLTDSPEDKTPTSRR